MMIVLHGGDHHHGSVHHRGHSIDGEGDPLLEDSTGQHPDLHQDMAIDGESTTGRLEDVSLQGGDSTSDLGGVSVTGNKSPMVRPVIDTGMGNINVRAAFVHVLGDLVQSVGVVIAAIVIFFKPEYKMADPICTFVFSFLVLCTTFQILRDTILILMEACPKYINHQEMKSRLSAVPGVRSVHNLRVWVLKGDRLVASVHLVLETAPEASVTDGTDVMSEAHKIFRSYLIEDCTIQLEKEGQQQQQQHDDENLLDA